MPTEMPRLGQGTWHLGEDGADRAAQAAALRAGIDLGMTLIDTAEMYADGGAEEVVAEAIAGQRDQVYLVSKAYPHNAGHRSLIAACERSLARLGTDHLDLYLLHWPGSIPIEETVGAFERLIEAGKIKAWGVSNFDLEAMQTLPPGCATNQVLYNLGSRGIEFDLLSWCRERGMPLIAYSPLSSSPPPHGQGGALLRSPALRAVAERHGATPAQVAIAWTLQPGVVSIPKSGNIDHVRLNAAAASLRLTAADRATLDAAHPAPRHKQPLDIL